MSEPCPKCKNTRYDHECHPHYARKYNGYCLDCENAGIPERDEELDRVRAQLAAAEKERARLSAQVDMIAGDLRIAEKERDEARAALNELVAHHANCHRGESMLLRELHGERQAVAELAAGLEQAKSELDWWVKNHGCCSGREYATMDMIGQLLAKHGAPK
jgi:hypothetical protein